MRSKNIFFYKFSWLKTTDNRLVLGIKCNKNMNGLNPVFVIFSLLKS